MYNNKRIWYFYNNISYKWNKIVFSNSDNFIIVLLMINIYIYIYIYRDPTYMVPLQIG